MTSKPDKFAKPEDFQDPLENYDPKQYDDPLEEALAEQPAVAIQSIPYTCVSTDTPIHEALQKLAKLHVACLLIEEAGELVGVFTDRDALDKVALEYDAVKDHPVSEVMATDPVFVYDTDSAAAVLQVMAVQGFRHVPVLDLQRKILGIASPQRITEFMQNYFVKD